jgi:hypothetical protein
MLQSGMRSFTSIQRNRADARDLSTELATPSPGRPLAPATRTWLEVGLGHDFANVQVHSDSQADELARSVNANAFTSGQDIYFKAGAYDLESADGRHRVAHEAAHVVQQAAGPVAGTVGSDGVSLSDPGDAFEQSAEQAANSLTAAQPAVRAVSAVSTPADIAVQREGGGEEEPVMSHWLANGATGFGIDQAAEHALGLHGVGGLFSGFGELMNGINEGGAHGTLEGTAGGLEMLGGIGDAAMAGLGMEGGMAAALLEPVGAGAAAALEGGSLLGAGAAGLAEVAGPAGLALGLGLLGGDALAKHTEVGEDTVGAIGGIDKALGWMGIGDPEHGQSAVVAMDDYRQEQWDKGGVGGYLKGTGALLGEGVVGAAGAIGGLAEGAYHGIESLVDWL